MQDERIKPTKENNCTETCPSYSKAKKMCAVTGHAPNPTEAPSELTGTPSPCDAAVHAVMDAYAAERKARQEKVPRQEMCIVSGTQDTFVAEVNERMEHRWRLFGSMIDIGSSNGPACYSQAMVRYKE